MSISTPPTSAKGLDLGAYEAVIAAVAAVFAAWKLFAPKFGRIRAIREEVGHLEFEFRVLYQFPQFVLIVITFGILAFLVILFFDSIYPGTLSAHVPGKVVHTVLAPQNLLWVVLSLSAFGAVIYWNLITRALVWVASLLALVPIQGLQNRYGRNGESVGWHQAVAVIEGPDKGQPLLLDYEKIDSVSSEILLRLHKDLARRDYAEEPANLSPAEKANIALFGCIMEANYNAWKWPPPNWAAFYASLADIQREHPMFGPSELLNFDSGHAFFEAFRDRLKSALSSRNQPLPPDDAFAAASDITDTWDALKNKANGDTLQLIPAIARFVGGPIAWLDKRLRGFPRLRSDGMRPQLIKLLVRWRVLQPSKKGVFTQPFSKRQAWLLLQLGVLRALPDMKEVTFYSTGQIPIARIAALRVIQRVNELINDGASLEARAVATNLQSSWTRLETSDFVFWSWAAADARQAGWDKSTWHWKFEDGRIKRND